MPIFLIIIITTLTGITYYLARRMHQGFSCFFKKLKFYPILILVSILTLVLVVGFARSMLPISSTIKQMLGVINSYCMGAFFYLFLFTIVEDLLMLVARLMRISIIKHPCVRGILTLSILIFTGITCVFGFIHGAQRNHVSYEIPLENKKDISDLNMILISDLHLGAIGSENQLEKIVDEINSLRPDIICIAGDFFDTDFGSIQNPQAAIETLRKLHSTYGTYACFGNHDAGATYPQMEAFLAEANITLLQDSYRIIDERFIIVGRLDSSPIGGFGEKKRQSFSSVFTRIDSSMPVIVLDHNPANIDEYGTNADLILCGHTHKGQVFPGSLITDLLYTVDYGYYRKDANNPHVIVTSGVGSWGMPMRVGTDCEIVNIRFTCNNN